MSNYRTRKSVSSRSNRPIITEERPFLQTATTITATTATIYVCATSGSPTGPFAWVARTVTPEGFTELCGHGGGHYMRLQIVAAIAALNALPEGSTVHVICSDKYLIEHVVGRLDALVAGKVKSKPPLKNRDLFPELQKARDRHDRVTAEVVPRTLHDAEHDEAMASVQRLVDQAKAEADFGETMPVQKARKARPEAESAHGAMDEPDATPLAATRGASRDVDLGVPW